MHFCYKHPKKPAQSPHSKAAAAAPTSFSLYSLPDVAIGHVSSFLQFKVVARLLKVSKSTQEAVYTSGGRGQFGRRRVAGGRCQFGRRRVERLILARHRHVWQASARITAHTQTLHRAALQITANKTSIKISCCNVCNEHLTLYIRRREASHPGGFLSHPGGLLSTAT